MLTTPVFPLVWGNVDVDLVVVPTLVSAWTEGVQNLWATFVYKLHAIQFTYGLI